MTVDEKLMEKDDIKKLNLPNELIVYFTESSRISDKLYTSVLKDLEDIYLLYSSLYNFKVSEFCSFAISCIERANKIDSFHYYLSKTLENHLERTEKNTTNFVDDPSKFIKLETKKFEEVTKEVVVVYINLVDRMYNEETINLAEVYEAFGKLEFMLKLNFDEYHKKLLDSGRNVLNAYVKKLQQHSELEHNV
ncbi:hypothetical protein [Neobacillus mesonae]|uniref:hypothetical protein n=1 Tax=Neobacillus mesonae TaxID=1193713 RepID=UPI00203BBF35|nr:hypothetical protein [Neobacillus mesonae]MCM3568680.1 hypothetical protein [Neobacillus mesonae]